MYKKFLYMALVLLTSTYTYTCTPETITTTPLQSITGENDYSFAYISDSLAVGFSTTPINGGDVVLYQVGSNGTLTSLNTQNIAAASILGTSGIAAFNNFVAVLYSDGANLFINTYVINNNTLVLAQSTEVVIGIFSGNIQYSPDGKILILNFSAGVNTYAITSNNTFSLSQQINPINKSAAATAISGNLAIIAFNNNNTTDLLPYTYSTVSGFLTANPGITIQANSLIAPRNVAFSPDGAYLAAIDTKNDIVIYNVTPTALTINTSIPAIVPGLGNNQFVTFANDTTLAVTGTDTNGNEFVQIYQLTNGTWQLLQDAQDLNTAIFNTYSFAYQPNGSVLAIANASGIFLYQVCTAFSFTVIPASVTLCANGTATVTTSLGNNPGYSFEWVNPQSTVISFDPSATLVGSQITSGIFSVNVENLTTTATETQTFQVTVNQLPSVTISASATSINAGQSVTLTAVPSAGTPPYTLYWYNHGNLVNTQTGVTGTTTYVVTPTSNASYSIIIKDANGCEFDPGVTINITVNSSPTPSVPTCKNCSPISKAIKQKYNCARTGTPNSSSCNNCSYLDSAINNKYNCSLTA